MKSKVFFNQQNLSLFLLIGLPLVIYWQVWDYDFIWDDSEHLKAPFVINPTFGNWLSLWKGYFGLYIPIFYTYLSFVYNAANILSVPVDSLLHISNVIIHIVNGLLVFTLLKFFIANPRAVLIGTLIFLLHPVQVESVAWISESRGLLATLFGLLALYYYLKKTTPTYGVIILIVLAILVKPSAIVFVLFFLAIDYFYYAKKLKPSIVKLLPLIFVIILISVVNYIVQYYHNTAGIFETLEIALWQRVFVWFSGIFFYFYKIIYPFDLGLYGLSAKFLVGQSWLYLLATIGAVSLTLFYLKQRKNKLVVLALVLFIVGFLPTSGLATFGFQTFSVFADRYIYNSFFAVALWVGYVINTVNHHLLNKFFWLIIVVLMGLSLKQISVWENDEAFWKKQIQTSFRPLSPLIHHMAQGDSKKALSLFGTKNQLHQIAKNMNNQGVSASKFGQYKLAIKHYTKAISIRKDYIRAYHNRSIAYYKNKQYCKALKDADTVKKLGGELSAGLQGAIDQIILNRQCL